MSTIMRSRPKRYRSRFSLSGATIPNVRSLIAPLARPLIAALVTLIIYLLRAACSPQGIHATSSAYFNYLADAFLHGQVALRVLPEELIDLVHYAGQTYLYWPPFPALLIAPLVALFGIGTSDVIYTAVFAALTIALLARFLEVLDQSGVAPLSVERRAILVAALAFGSVLLILAPVGSVWFTAQIIGWGCVLIASIAALTGRGHLGYFVVGLALACAFATRLGLLFNGIWLAYYLLRRDRDKSPRWRYTAVALGLAPIEVTAALLGWYNAVRFGSPLDMGLAWHAMGTDFTGDFVRYGAFNLHYLPKNLYYQFIAHPLLTENKWLGGGVFWMTPILLGAPYAVWRDRREPLIWALLASCALVYIPVGLVMGTSFITFGPRYLLDLMVPLIVLTAIGIRNWRLNILQGLMLAGILTYSIGSALWWFKDYQLLWNIP